MANLVIKSQQNNKGFNVQRQVFNFPFSKEKVQLLITSEKLRSIDSKDFTTGALPAQVSKVEFDNLGDKVVAILHMRSGINLKKNMVLNIPIIGKSFVKLDFFSVNETTTIFGSVSVTGFSPNTKSVDGDKTKYTVRNSFGKKALIFSKTFSVAKDFVFSSQPTCVISGGANGYNVVSKIKRGKGNKIISKTFDIYYTSLKNPTPPTGTRVMFLASSHDITPRIAKKTDRKDNVIYAVSKGKDPGPRGGVKKIKVKGVPGSTFSILVSNSDGEMYDMATGSFSNSGGLIEGTVPIAFPGKSYGESIIRINVPRSATTQTITTEFQKQEDPAVVIAKIANAPSAAANIISTIKTVKKKTLAATTPTLTFGVTTTNYLGPKVKILSGGATVTSTDVFLGKEGRETLKFTEPGQYSFAFKVSAAAINKVVQLTRQPLFSMPRNETDNYVAWDSDATKKVLAQTAAGVAIPSDWDWQSIGKETKAEIKMKCAGVGKILSTDTISGASYFAYAEVQVVGEIRVVNVGEASSQLNLRLDNFLSVIERS